MRTPCIPYTGDVSSVSFSPDGYRVLAGFSEGTVKLYDAKSGAEAFTFKGHTRSVISTSFSSDGSRLLTGSHDGTAKILDSRPLNREFLPKELAPLPRAKR